MPLIISIIGYSNSGKTTLVESLVPRLKQKGVRVGTVKHTSHGFTIDQRGKDSFRHKSSGSDMTIVSGPKSLAMIRDTKANWGLGKIVRHYMREMDLVLAEGYKNEDFLKIEIIHDPDGEDVKTIRHAAKADQTKRGRIFSDHEKNLVAIVSDQNVETGKKIFKRNDVDELADFIFLLYQNDQSQVKAQRQIIVEVNGRNIPMNEFVQTIVYNSISGMVGSLKKTEQMESIDIHIKL